MMVKDINKIISGTINVDSVLFSDSKEIFYLTGAEFDGFWLLYVSGKTYAICSKMIENQVKEFFFGKGVNVYSDVPFYKAILKILEKNDVEKIFVDPKYMSALDFILLNKGLNKVGIKVESKIGILDNVRMIKKDDEIENIREACNIVSKVCNTVRKELRPGLREIDVHYRVLELFAGNHVTESFTPIIAFGKNSSDPHHRSSDKKLIQNDIVMMDIGCVYNNYCSDLTRTYFLDENYDLTKKHVWETVKRSQEAVLKEIKAGLPIVFADKIARNAIENAGYKDRFIHTTGHGVGIEIHEMPSLSSNAEGIFLAGMVVSVEPGIYIEQEFGVRIEDTVLVKENGCEILTTAIYQ